MKRNLITCLTLFVAALTAEMPTHLRYVKFGNEIGAGYRFHERGHGVDFSMNYAPLFGQESWYSGKVLYLAYPFHSSQNYFYAGTGAGFLHHPFDPGHKMFATGELLVGYEFFPQSAEKLFLQVGASIPLAKELASPFDPIDPSKERWKPTVTLGFGF